MGQKVCQRVLIEQLEDGIQTPRTYDIYIEPYFFNTNAMGYCGGFVTFELTLTSGDQVLIDQLRFNSECGKTYWSRHDKDAATGGFGTVEVNPENRVIWIFGSLDEEYEDDFVFQSYFKFDEDLPILDSGLKCTTQLDTRKNLSLGHRM